MSDEARIERLTELARKVWPDRPLEIVAADEHIVEGTAWEVVEDGGPEEDSVCYLRVLSDPHALDTLEAALLVLAGEGFVSVFPLALETPVWVEQLASEWDQHTDETGSYRLCARELRERARGGA